MRALGVEALSDELLTGDTADFSGSACQHGPVSTPGCDSSADFQNQPQWLKDWFNGDNPGRLGFVLLGEIGFIAGALVLLIIAGTVAVAQLVFLFCVLGAPVVFLAGLHPTFGRAVLARWLDVTLGALVIRVVYSLLLGLLLITDSTVAAGFAGCRLGGRHAAAGRSGGGAAVPPPQALPLDDGCSPRIQAYGGRGCGRAARVQARSGRLEPANASGRHFHGGAGWARGQRHRASAEHVEEPPDEWEEPGVRDSEWREVAQPALRAMPYNPLGPPGAGSVGGGMPPGSGGGLPPPGLAPAPAPAVVGTAESGVAALGTGGSGPMAASGAGGATGATVGAEAAATSSGAGVPAVAAAYVAAKAGEVARKTARAYPTAIATDIGSGLSVLPGPIDEAHATARPGPMPAPEPPTEPIEDVVDMVRGEDGKWYPWRSGGGESS